ncbi:glycosyltransferase [Sphingobacterium prati]|uniref:glycosyltransferase n=1 Tax=Sphingobacterium prati TaxID=2737006 RepID=UPI00155828BA|nr:glycosyltransferase [Sphingobacterium prati]NPE45860.1 glycosyltransferase [Sphingobacterium prati]
MVNIVFVVHTFDESQIGGVLKITSMQANALAKRGWKVSILSLGQVITPAYKLCDEVELHCLDQKYYDTRQLRSIMKILFFSKSYAGVLNFMRTQNRNTIFITTSPPISILFSLFDKRFKIIGCDHTATTYSKGGLTFVINLLKRRLDCMIGLTPEDTLYYENQGIVAEYIPNFIDEDTSKSLIGNDVVFIGRFSKEKNPLGALRIFYKSCLYKRGVRMRIYGYGDLKQDILDLIRAFDIQQFVSVIEGESDPNVMLDNVRCLLLTSEIEGFGMVLLEAMSKGIYCISYDVGYGPKNILRDGLNGFLVEQDREHEAAYKLVEIFDGLVNSDSNKIRGSIAQFSTIKVIKKWEVLLKKLSH